MSERERQAVPPRRIAPRYGEASLAEVMPSLLSALGVAGFPNRLALPATRRACLLLVDGLGWQLLQRHGRLVPFLASLLPSSRSITAVFPASTAPSLASLSTGVPPGEHGLTGYAMALPGLERPLNVVMWSLYGARPAVDLRERAVPERVQAVPPLLTAAAPSGVVPTIVAPGALAGTGLTRALWRGVRFVPVGALDAAQSIQTLVAALTRAPRTVVYTYHGHLDGAGHRFGMDSDEWRHELRRVDALVERLASALPPDAILLVTGDHGMVDMPLAASTRIDPAEEPGLARGVRFLGGDPRARHVYVRPGATAEVLAAWRERLGDAMWIVTREEAIEGGWFGPRVLDHVRPRIGDVIAATFGDTAVVERSIDPATVDNVGQHGSLTADEAIVPLIVARGDDT